MNIVRAAELVQKNAGELRALLRQAADFAGEVAEAAERINQA